MFVRDGRRFLEYRSYPRLTLRIDGTEPESTTLPLVPVSGRAHRNRRREWEVTTTARLTFEESGLLYEIRCRNDADDPPQSSTLRSR